MHSVSQSFPKKISRSILLLISFVILGNQQPLEAACRGEGFLGITSKDPIMSWVDLTFSPLYTSSSTSGTAGCKNWDFAEYMEKTRKTVPKVSHQQVMEEIVQGGGSNLDALTQLMNCSDSSRPIFSRMLWEHRDESISVFETSKHAPEFLISLKSWIRTHPELSQDCHLS